MILKSGEIYWVNLDPSIGDEIRKKRLVIVVNGRDDKNLKLAIVAPITDWNPHWDKNPFFVSIKPDPRNNLKKRSVVDCFQIRSISHNRFMEKIGNLPNHEIDLLKKAISLILDIYPEHYE